MLCAILALTLAPAKPNIVYILADDLGSGDLGVYGQKWIKTPNIDRLAKEGIRFTQHYSGSTVCAPARSVFLTGQHTGHTPVRDNYEMGNWDRNSREGQLPLPENTPTLPRMLKREGYATAAIGKWGLGGPGTTGEPNRQGFDLFFGYLCQRIAHNYYPGHLWRNTEKVPLDNPYFPSHQKLTGDPANPASYAGYSGKQYAPDLMIDEAVGFVRANKDRPFFLYFASPIPHAALQVPERFLAPYLGTIPDSPYAGERSYLPHPTPRAAYAAMVSHLDADVGRIMATLKELGLDSNTLVVFSSDNGATFNGGTDTEFFKSNGALRGVKTQLYEGGIRVPLVARWPGRIAPGTTSAVVSAMWDMLPTFAEASGAATPQKIDGLSLMPTLTGAGKQKTHDHLYWEFHAGGGWQAVRQGSWKLIRRNAHRPEGNKLELYNLANDPAEAKDLASEQPARVRELSLILAREHTISPVTRWNFR